jgi:hypothetical protein
MTFNNLLKGVSDALRFGVEGGLLKWLTNHFAVHTPEGELANIKVALATEAEDAVQYSQLLAVSDSAKGVVKEITFCLNKAGAVNPNYANGMLRRGAIIKEIGILVSKPFDGTPTDATKFNIAMNDDDNTVVFDRTCMSLTRPGLYIYKPEYILGENIDMAINMALTAGTTGDALVSIRYVEPVLYDLVPGGSLIFTPSRKIMHLDFLGDEGETTTIIFMDGTQATCGIVDGNFVFDIPNVTGLTHTFTTEGEEYTFTLGGYEYLIINETEEV